MPLLQRDFRGNRGPPRHGYVAAVARPRLVEADTLDPEASQSQRRSWPKMTCDDSRLYLPAYLDDELDVSDSLRVQKHLADCQACQQTQEQQLVLRSALRDPDLRAYPSADFSKRIEAAVRRAAKEEALARRFSRFDFLRFESLRWMPAAAVLLLVTTVGAFLATNSLRSSHQQLIASAVLAGHIRS